MMILQADALQIGSVAVSLTTLGLVLRLSFGAGQLVEKVDGHDWRITAHDKRLDHLEETKCPHPECPLLRGHVSLAPLAPEHEG
jgi:hypothetical protein